VPSLCWVLPFSPAEARRGELTGRGGKQHQTATRFQKFRVAQTFQSAIGVNTRQFQGAMDALVAV